MSQIQQTEKNRLTLELSRYETVTLENYLIKKRIEVEDIKNLPSKTEPNTTKYFKKIGGGYNLTWIKYIHEHKLHSLLLGPKKRSSLLVKLSKEGFK